MGQRYQDVILADSPVAYWRLGESAGTSAADASGNGHTGTYENTPTLAVAGALRGNADTAVTFASASSEDVLTTTLGTLGSGLLTSTAEFWINTTTTSTLQAVFGTVNTGTSTIYAVYLNTNNAEAGSVGKTCFHIRGTGGAARWEISTNIYDGAWHHVAWAVSSGTVSQVYVDGRAVTTTIVGGGAASGMVDFGFALTLAARNVRGTLDRFASCSLDEVALYASTLTAEKVARHYYAGIAQTKFASQGVG